MDNIAMPFLNVMLTRADVEALEAYASEHAAAIRRRMPRD
jgi:hypothetical protein